MSYSIRRATVDDAAVIAGHRVAMFSDMGQVPSNALGSALLSTSTSALTTLLHEGSYIGWLAVDAGGAVLAGVGAHVKPHLPRISPDGAAVVAADVPLVVNVYTERAFRNKG